MFLVPRNEDTRHTRRVVVRDREVGAVCYMANHNIETVHTPHRT
jgi:hypothetical protein